MNPRAIELHPASGTLDQHCVIWRVDLDALGADDADMARLDAVEQARLGRLRFAHDRRRRLAAQVATRWLLGRAMDCAPEHVHIVRGPMGKPGLDSRPALSAPHFNLSHSGGIAVLALSTAGEVGIDIELRRPLPELAQLVASHLDPEEQACWSGMPPSGRDAAFLAHWTRKEAVLKALGIGLDMPTRAVGCGDPARSAVWHPASPSGCTVQVGPTWSDSESVVSVARLLTLTSSVRGTLAA